MHPKYSYYQLVNENNALKHHYNHLVNVLNSIYENSEIMQQKNDDNHISEPKKNEAIVEMLKKQNALLNRVLIQKNKQIGFLKSTKYDYLTSPRSANSIQVDQLSEISEFSCCGRSCGCS